MATELQEEIQQNRPFPSLQVEGFLNLRRTHEALHSKITRFLKDSDISLSHYNILRILRGAGVDGLPVQRITDRMVVRRPDITRLVDKLENSGLVTRQRLQRDRRVVMVHITEKGLALVKSLETPLESYCANLLGHMTQDELAELNRLLVKARWPVNRTPREDET